MKRLALLAALGALAGPLRADVTPAGVAPRGALADVAIVQHLDAQLPADVTFNDEDGRPVRFGSLLGSRPFVLAFIYFRCPMLCSYVQDGLIRSLRAISFDAGKDFDVIAVSIDPTDTPALAKTQKGEFVRKYGRPNDAGGVHFLTGDVGAISKLAAAAGFRYNRDPETGTFNHAAGIMVATASGRLSHYFYGIEYPPQDLRLALVAASKGKIGGPVDQILLYCCQYDPTTGRYSLAITRVLQIAGGATVAGIFLLLVILSRRSRRGNDPVAEAR